MEEVILVNPQDEEIGTMEKLEAHKKGLLHRAFSILIFNSDGEMLLQRRAATKYHSGGLWTNACCSHPLPGESFESATRRKLFQEMGINVDLTFGFSFIYKAILGDLIEHEIDHVFIGTFDGIPDLNPEEADAFKFLSLDNLRKDIYINPDDYTAWFKIILNHPALASRF